MVSAHGTGRHTWTAFVCLALLLGTVTLALGQSPASDTNNNASTATPTVEQADQASPAATSPAPRVAKDPKNYGLWVLAPALAAILLAILTRQVVPALVVGVIVGAYMLLPCQAMGSAIADGNSLINGFRLAMEKYVIGAIHEPPDAITGEQDFRHIEIMIFTLVIGFMVGVIGRNGGTAGLVKIVAGSSESPRRTGLTAWLAGLVVFFDDYANSMIVGPTMRSVFDKVKMSRAKLAYIVDSTAAPVASLALIGTWVGAEIGFIDKGIQQVTGDGVPAFLATDQGTAMSGMQVFIQSLPYRFYPILAIFLVFLITWTRRDFGPMKKSEARAASGAATSNDANIVTIEDDGQPVPRWWLGLIPVLCLVAVTVAVLILSGKAAVAGTAATGEATPLWERWLEIIRHGDAYLSIYYGAILSAILAVLMTVGARACKTRDAIDSGLEGMARMFPAVVILILAWALSDVEKDLMLGQVASDWLAGKHFSPMWLPLAIFISSAVVSFATGTSWGTMGILCPATVAIVAGLVGSVEPAQAVTLFYASVGSVLAGAVFGDHCSPISDTTVLSSIASGCRHEEHVWTQLPYALITAIAAMGLGDVLCSVYHQRWYFGLGSGAVFLFLVVLIVGRRPKVAELPPSAPRPVPMQRWQPRPPDNT